MRVWSLYLRARRPGRDDDIGKSPGKASRIPEAEKGADNAGRRIFEGVGTGEYQVLGPSGWGAFEYMLVGHTKWQVDVRPALRCTKIKQATSGQIWDSKQYCQLPGPDTMREEPSGTGANRRLL